MKTRCRILGHRWISNKKRFKEKFGKGKLCYFPEGSICIECDHSPEFCTYCDIPKCDCRIGDPVNNFRRVLLNTFPLGEGHFLKSEEGEQ